MACSNLIHKLCTFSRGYRPVGVLFLAVVVLAILSGAQCKHEKKIKLVFVDLAQSVPGEAAGQSFSFTVEVQNIGNKSSGGFIVQAYLSDDQTFSTTDDTLIGQSGIAGSIGKGASTLVTINATVPPLYPSGEWILYVSIPGKISSPMRFPVLVSSTTPDFTVAGLGMNKTLIQRGTSVAVDWNLANLGSGTGTVRNGFFLGLNPTHSGADTYLGMDVAPNYSPGSSYEATSLLTIPGNTPPGIYYFLFVANYDTAITEIDQFNNTFSIPIFITTNTGIDYVVGHNDVGDQIVIGQGTTLTVTQQVANAGTIDAATGVELGAYLMRSATLASTTGILVGATGTNSLTAGSVQSVTFNLVIPPTLAPGTYWLGYVVDDLNFQVESNEGNNASPTIQIQVVADDTFENNDTQASAANLTKATLESDLVSLINDEDWYRVTVGGFTNQVTATVTNTTPGDITCSIYDGLGILQNAGAATGTGWASTLAQLKPGNYYFRLQHTTADFTTDYTFRVDTVEQPAVLVGISGTLNVDESLGNTDTYTVALSRLPLAGETVTLTLTFNAAQINVAPATINFTNANYTTPVTITVSAVNDGTPEGTQTFQIQTAITTTDGTSDYNSALAANMPVQVTD